MKKSVSVAGLIILALFLLVVSVMAASEPSTISPALKLPDNSKPYDDASFQERASYAIYHLTNPMPTGNTLMELKSLYYEIIRKNISPEFFSEAKDTANYLFYALKAAEGTQDLGEHTSPSWNSVGFYQDINDQAQLDLSAAKQLWPNISASYPNATCISDE